MILRSVVHNFLAQRIDVGWLPLCHDRVHDAGAAGATGRAAVCRNAEEKEVKRWVGRCGPGRHVRIIDLGPLRTLGPAGAADSRHDHRSPRHRVGSDWYLVDSWISA